MDGEVQTVTVSLDDGYSVCVRYRNDPIAKTADKLCYDEALGLLATVLRHKDKHPGLQWLMTPAERALRNESRERSMANRNNE